MGRFAGSSEGRSQRQILVLAGQFDGTETEGDGTTMLTPRSCLSAYFMDVIIGHYLFLKLEIVFLVIMNKNVVIITECELPYQESRTSIHSKCYALYAEIMLL